MSLIEHFESVVENSMRRAVPFSPASLNDEVALKTEWRPIKKSGANFKTVSLKKIRPNVLAYKQSPMAIAFPILFSSLFMFGAVVLAMEFEEKFGYYVYIAAAFFLFVPVVIMIYYIINAKKKNAIIDNTINLFYRGKSPNRRDYTTQNEDHCRLSDVHAIQLVEHYFNKRTSSDTSSNSYYNYEINFVLNDATRLNVMASSSLKQIRKDVEVITQMLGVPVWDAIR